MTAPTITITKIDHDSWWGYYIGDKLYGYDDYYNFSDDEVRKEAVLQAIDDGIIKTRKETIETPLVYHTDWPGMNDTEGAGRDRDLYDEIMSEFSNSLPSTLTELKTWYANNFPLPEGGVKATFWTKMGDHPKVWEDYDSSCGGDTNLGRFYIGNPKDAVEVFSDSIIIDMADGQHCVVISST